MSPDGTGPSKAGHLLSQTLRRRTPLLLLLAITLIIIYPFRSTLVPVQPFEGSATGTTVSPSALESPSDNAAAAAAAGLEASSRSISAHDLLSRPISRDLTSIPKIIHQTWFPAGSNMSESAAGWVETMKKHHPDWEYVLWDDESDEALVREYFPWFLETYRSLPQEINRADMARNFYMFLFGGMYADVDTEALRSVNSLFAAHDVTLKPHWDALSADSTEKTVQRAFMGRMAHTLDPEGLGAIPNGWMASPPGHPFWLLPVLAVMENPKGDGSVEGMTGPGILGPLIKQYYHTYGDGGAAAGLRRQLCRRVQSVQPSWELFCPGQGSLEAEDGGLLSQGGEGEGLGHSLVLLPREQVYPFSWVDNSEVKVCFGAKWNGDFDAEACKRAMRVDAWPSYFITYCTHTW